MENLLSFILLPPLLTLFILTLAWWLSAPLPERRTCQLVLLGFSISGLASVYGLLSHGLKQELVVSGHWFTLGHYDSLWQFSMDPLSLVMSTLTCTLICVIAIFSESYLHQEAGFFRFYLLMNLFGVGVEFVVLAGSLEQVFFGWELVGLTSALLIAFFAHRPGPAHNGFRAFLTYRLCDIGLLSAVVWLHHNSGSAAFELSSGQAWLGLPAQAAGQETIIVLLLLFATLGKSALYPVGGWLPRAMEGPTPSSAVFYGALSVHLGPYLLLRARPMIEVTPWGAAAVVLIGLATAFHGSIVGRIQSDVKGALAYGSMTQVGLIVAEIGLGLETLAVLHIIGHACLRTLEILRAPSVLHEYHNLELSLGSVLPRMGQHYERLLSPELRQWLYRVALGRGLSEPILLQFVRQWRQVFLQVDRWERKLENTFAGPEECSEQQQNTALELVP